MSKTKWRDLLRASMLGDIAAAKKDVGVEDGAGDERNSSVRPPDRLRVASVGCSAGPPSIPSKRAGGTSDIEDNRRDHYRGGNYPTDGLHALMGKEVRKYAMDLKTDRRCALCPFRAFSRPCRVRGHLESYHTAEKRWCAPGAKKLRTCKDLYEHDKKTAGPGGVYVHAENYPRGSADIIRSGVSLFSDVSDLDMDALTPVGSVLRIAQRASWPVFLQIDYLDSGFDRFRRLGYGIYSEDFYNEVDRLALDHQGRVQKVQGKMRNLRKNGLSALRPKFIEVWEAIACDIFFSYVG